MSNENGNGNHRNGANNNGHQRNGQVNGSANGHQNGNANHDIPANGVTKNGNGNGHHPADAIPAHDLLWDSLPASVTEKLAQPLDASLVSQRKGRGNRSFSYVEGRTVIDQANRIFGFGGWGHEVVGDVTLQGPGPGEHADRRGQAHPGLLRHGEGHRPRRPCPHRRGLPAGLRRDRRRA